MGRRRRPRSRKFFLPVKHATRKNSPLKLIGTKSRPTAPVFFDTHDPTTLNKQGADVGTQYRSAIFYHDDQQLQIAKDIKNALADKFDNPIVTELTPFTVFYEAESEHHDYYNLNPSQPYCSAVISPKVKKLLTSHSKLLKEKL